MSISFSKIFDWLTQFWTLQIISSATLDITLGTLLTGTVVFFVGIKISRFLIRRTHNLVLNRWIKDPDTQLWLQKFLSFIALLILLFVSLLIIGFPFDVLGSVWHLTLFTVKDHTIELGNIILGLILLYPGVRFSRYLAHEFQMLFLNQLKLDMATKKSIETIFRYILIIIVVLFVLTIVGIPLTAFTLIGGAVAIGLGLGSQNLVNNFLSGLVLMMERPLKVGDVVDVENRGGTVEYIGGRSTRIRTFDNVRLVIPNSQLLENTVINWSLEDTVLRREVEVGVAYGSDTELVKTLILKAANEHPTVELTPEPVVLFDSFGDNALTFKVLFWIQLTESIKPLIIESDVRFKIDRFFREAGITIAFPQRDLHLDTSRPLDIRMTSAKSDENTDES